MSTVAEATRTVERPVSRGRWLRRSPIGRFVTKAPFWLLIAVIFVYALFPFYWAIRSAFTPDGEQFKTPVDYFPQHPTFANFREALSTSTFQHALINSTIVAGAVTLISLLVGSLAAYALGRFRFRGKSAVLYLMLSMTIFPQIAILGALYTMINDFHLYDKLGALILSYMIFTLPFTVWVLTSFMRGLPGDLEEAAYVDGAPARLHRRLERVPVRALVHSDTGPLHRAAGDHDLRRQVGEHVPATVGADHGRDRDRHPAADHRDSDSPAPHSRRPHGGRGQGLSP